MDRLQQDQLREKQKQKLLEKEMKKQRVRQLKTANEEEDKVIRRLEKQLKIDKTRSEKHVPKMFNDGLEYALELCLPENIQKMYTAAKEAAQSDSDDGFDEDLQIASGNSGNVESDKKKQTTGKNNKMKEDDNPRKVNRKMAKLRKVEGKFFDDDDDLDSDLSGVDSELELDDNESKSEASEGSDFDMINSEDEDVSSDEAPEERPIGKTGKSTRQQKKSKVTNQEATSDSDSESDPESLTEQPGKFVRKPISDSENESENYGLDDILGGMSITITNLTKKILKYFL